MRKLKQFPSKQEACEQLAEVAALKKAKTKARRKNVAIQLAWGHLYDPTREKFSNFPQSWGVATKPENARRDKKTFYE
jgi:chromatin remodeling complex protein RSC6